MQRPTGGWSRRVLIGIGVMLFVTAFAIFFASIGIAVNAHNTKLTNGTEDFDTMDVMCVKPNSVECPPRTPFWAPQRHPDGEPNTQDQIAAYCNQVNSMKVQQGSVIYNMFEFNGWGIWLTASMPDEAREGDSQCEEWEPIVKDDCIRLMTTAMITCDPNSGSTYGANGQGTCIKYCITPDPDGQNDFSSPPWARDPNAGHCQPVDPSNFDHSRPIATGHVFRAMARHACHDWVNIGPEDRAAKWVNDPYTVKNYTTPWIDMPLDELNKVDGTWHDDDGKHTEMDFTLHNKQHSFQHCDLPTEDQCVSTMMHMVDRCGHRDNGKDGFVGMANEGTAHFGCASIDWVVRRVPGPNPS